MSRILVIGADGMIGYGLWTYLRNFSGHEVTASIRTRRDLAAFGEDCAGKVVVGAQLATDDGVEALFADAEADVVINCAGVTFHTKGGKDPLVAIPANSLLPHRLHKVVRRHGARLVHITTDCVYRGDRGNYSETDEPDATGLYARSKVLGEIADADDALTIRTSTVGYELSSARGLLGWFLAQRGTIKGFTNAWFSGLATPELARVIDEYVIDDPTMHGLYHVAGAKISKYELLSLLKTAFGSPVEIVPDDALKVDRSLDATRFNALTGYVPPSWDRMIDQLVRFAEAYPETANTAFNGGQTSHA